MPLTPNLRRCRTAGKKKRRSRARTRREKMKYAKSLVPALLATALMALAATASATTVTSPAGTVYTGTGKFTGVNENGHVTIHNPIGAIQCSSTFDAELEEHGAGQTVKGTMTELRFASCTSNWHVTVVAGGSLEIHSIEGGSDGTLTSTGATIAATRFGVPCVYTTASTDIGTVTSGHPATLDVEANLPLGGGSSELCGSGSVSWTGAYRISTPTMLFVDP
jgi:hypothetical protein